MPPKRVIKKAIQSTQQNETKIEDLPQIEITKVSDHKFTHIIHISDTHIRPSERHDEFKHVFEKLYHEIQIFKSQNVKAIIIITGDIFDNKHRFSPEQYELCNYFFDTLSNLFPLIVIAGNHDMKDIDRLDSITPSAYHRPNFHYLSKSGAYEFGDIVFSVTSLYDNSQKFIKREQITTTKKCIALYHGTISGSSNDEGFVFQNDNTSRFKTKNDFANYDAVLLGDIHKMQMLTPTMGYAGSLVQQNFGESLRGHGYLLWDLKDKIIATFHDIKSDYGFVKVIIKDNIWVNSEIEFPLKSTIRMELTNSSEIQDEIEKKIKSKTEPIGIIDKRYNDEILTLSNIPIESHNMDNKKDVFIDELNNAEYTPDEIKALTDIHNECKKVLKYTETTEIAYLWTPLELKFMNMCGYAGSIENKIDFKQGVMSICALNSTGKTSIINILFFAIFGRLLVNPGKSKKSGIINNKEIKATISLKLRHGVTDYTINRTLKKINSVNEMKHDVSISNSNKTINETGESANKRISKLFGKIEDFYKCNVLNNNDQSNDFFQMTNGGKIDYLKQIFRLTDFDILTKKIKELKKDLENEKKIKMTEYNTINSNNIETPISELNIILNKLREHETIRDVTLNNILSKYSVLNKEIIIKEEQIKNIPNLNINDLIQKKEFLESETIDLSIEYNILSLKNQIENNKKQIITNHLDKHTLKKQIKEKEIEINKLSPYDSNKTEKELYKLITDKKSQIKYLNAELLKNENDKIQYINTSNVINTTKSIPELEKEIEILQKQYVNTKNNTKEEITKKIAETKKSISALSKFKTTDKHIEKKYDDITNEINQLKKSLRTLKKPSQKCAIDNKNIDTELIKLKENKKELYQHKQLNIIDNKKHSFDKNKLNSITEELETLLSNYIADDEIDKYILSLSMLNSKNTLTAKDFIKYKKTLFIPVHHLLKSVKDSNISETRERIKLLNETKNDLIVNITNTENLILENEEIEILMKKNREIKVINYELAQQLENLEYYKIEFRVDSLLIDQSNLSKSCEYLKLSETLKQYTETLTSIIGNNKLDSLIKHLKDSINVIKYVEISEKIKIITEQLNELTNEVELLTKQYRLITVKEELSAILNDILMLEKSEKLILDNIELEKCIKREITRQEYNDVISKIESTTKLNIINSELVTLRKNLEVLAKNKDKYSNALQQNRTDQNNINRDIKFKVNNDDKITDLKKNISILETKIKNHKKYSELIGPTGLQLKIIQNKLVSIEAYINDIMEKYTKYKVKMSYDKTEENVGKILEKTKQKADSGLIDIYVEEKGNMLSLERLCGYEKLVLSIAFKRALNRHTNYSKSGIFIMDESVECMDATNFTNVLPDITKLIFGGYSSVLIISQRDITHISDSTIKISIQDGISRIIT